MSTQIVPLEIIDADWHGPLVPAGADKHTRYRLGKFADWLAAQGRPWHKTEDGRLIVHVDGWSRWQGEPSTERIHEVIEADLRAGGRFEQLGFEAGYQDAFTLDEALRSARLTPCPCPSLATA
jgi:hypothetical protein